MPTAVVRPILVLLALLAATLLLALHGVRALAILIAVAVLLMVAQSPVWRSVEAPLVRVTGSRRRAFGLLGVVAIGVLLAVSLYQLAG